ncbi:hypothetical protein ACIRVK_12165 [Streptomyces sp. NPDC101152]|uniref:hypothetical protein n=1 Tax=Streptomyces sp. NPDC101152 TaxID=3366116 RepID=UPI003830DBAC
MAGRARAAEPHVGTAPQAYVAWLALNASPTDVVLAITANFSAWGGYCGIFAQSLRTHYGFASDDCALFDFEAAHRDGRLLQSYEAMFWATLPGVA